jgi:hypothetical protein
VSNYQKIIQKFGITDAIYRGGAIAYNLLAHSVIANCAGFGAEGVLAKTFLTFGLSEF